jgi:hypothetical protein
MIIPISNDLLRWWSGMIDLACDVVILLFGYMKL